MITFTLQNTIVNGCRYINSISTSAKILVSSNNYKIVTTSRLLTRHVSHNSRPFCAVRINRKRINLSCDNMRRLMSRHIFYKRITIPVQHIIVDGDKVLASQSISTTLALQLERDRGHWKLHAVHLLRLGEDFFDSLDCLQLQFSHALRLAPCTTSSRKKCERVGGVLPPPPPPPPGGGGGGGGDHYNMPLGGRQAE